jgi:hypothetical protein
MSVYYRYRSGLRAGHGAHHLRSRPEAPHLGNQPPRPRSDARTREEYTDDNAQIPRSSTVVVRRVAGGPPAETITVVRPPPPPPKAAQDTVLVDATGKPSSSAQDDDEDRAISAVIDAAQLKWEDRRRPSQGARCYYGRRDAQEQSTPLPPAGYVCHRFRVPGHFIQHCPTNGDPRFDFRRAPTNANLPASAPVSNIPDDDDDGILPELHCKMCKKVMADAVVTGRCCFDSFCDACIRRHVAAKSKCVCGAHASADDLIPNQTLRVTIANKLAAGASGSTDNQKSSTGSNEKATSKSPAASQGSRSQVTEACSDGSASSTSKSAATLAVREPRTAESAQTMACGGYPDQYGYGGPFVPACYDPFYGGMPWAYDPYAHYGVPYGGGYPMTPASAGYHDGGHGRKRSTGHEDGRLEEPSFKKRRGSRSMVVV